MGWARAAMGRSPGATRRGAWRARGATGEPAPGRRGGGGGGGSVGGGREQRWAARLEPRGEAPGGRAQLLDSHHPSGREAARRARVGRLGWGISLLRHG